MLKKMHEATHETESISIVHSRPYCPCPCQVWKCLFHCPVSMSSPLSMSMSISSLNSSSQHETGGGRKEHLPIQLWDEAMTTMCTVYSTALHCTALYCTALYCTALYCTALYCTALYCTALHCTALYCTVLHCTVCCCMKLCHSAQH